MSTEIIPLKWATGKKTTVSYERWLSNGRTETATLDQAEELDKTAQDLFPHAIDLLGLDAGKWGPTGYVTKVSFKYGDDDGGFDLQIEVSRVVKEDEFMEQQKLVTGVIPYNRLARLPYVYHAAEGLRTEIIRFVESQPIQGNLFSPKLEVIA